jgi:hypothetical protein
MTPTLTNANRRQGASATRSGRLGLASFETARQEAP